MRAAARCNYHSCITAAGAHAINDYAFAYISRKLKSFNPDGLIVRQGTITANVQDAASNLKVICKHGVGTDNIDIDAATARSIPVMFTPGANSESVAEHTLALILSLIRRIPVQDRQIRSGVFSKKSFDGQELLGKNLGIIGYGRIGRRLSELVSPFKMNVVVYHPSCTNENLPKYIVKAQTVEDVVCRSDIISLHCPLTPVTRGMINKTTIAQMKEGAYIINTARGPLVNEEDLIQALKEKSIAGAALDCFEKEPLAVDSPLLRLDNVILTAHVAGTSDESLRNIGTTAVRHVISMLRGEPVDVRFILNSQVLKG